MKLRKIRKFIEREVRYRVRLEVEHINRELTRGRLRDDELLRGIHTIGASCS